MFNIDSYGVEEWGGKVMVWLDEIGNVFFFISYKL